MSSLTKPTRSPCSASSSARIGSTALHGPHQGAQKSTTTGRPAWRTSCSNVLSPTSSTPATLQAACERPEAQRRDLPDRLEHDRAAHLRAAAHEVDVAGGLDQARQVGRVVREVAVDLDDQLGVPVENAPEAGQVGGAETLLPLAVEHLDVVELGGQPVGQLAGSVG